MIPSWNGAPSPSRMTPEPRTARTRTFAATDVPESSKASRKLGTVDLDKFELDDLPEPRNAVRLDGHVAARAKRQSMGRRLADEVGACRRTSRAEAPLPPSAGERRGTAGGSRRTARSCRHPASHRGGTRPERRPRLDLRRRPRRSRRPPCRPERRASTACRSRPLARSGSTRPTRRARAGRHDRRFVRPPSRSRRLPRGQNMRFFQRPPVPEMSTPVTPNPAIAEGSGERGERCVGVERDDDVRRTVVVQLGGEP